MATWFGVFNLAPFPLQDQRLAILLDRTHPLTIRTRMFPPDRDFLSPLGQVPLSQLTSQLVPNFGSQQFQIEQRRRSSKRRLFFRHKLLSNLPNPLPQLVIHDLSPQDCPNSGNPNDFPRPKASQIRSQPQSAECTPPADPY